MCIYIKRLCFYGWQVYINSKGLVYSVVLLLGSVFLTVSITVISFKVICITKSDCIQYFSAALIFSVHLSLLSPFLSITLSAGPECSSEPLVVGPQTGSLSHDALCHLPTLLGRLPATVGQVPKHFSMIIMILFDVMFSLVDIIYQLYVYGYLVTVHLYLRHLWILLLMGNLTFIFE